MEQKELINVLYDGHVINTQYLKTEVSSLVNDTRKVENNSCFIAIKGENFDGHQAIEDVINKGAKLIIVEDLPQEPEQFDATIVQVASTFRTQAILANQYYNEPSTKLNVVAVTGTNGKTTTSNMISQLLESLDRKTGVIGTLHYKVGDKYYPAVNTTPNALEMQGSNHTCLTIETVEDRKSTRLH